MKISRGEWGKQQNRKLARSCPPGGAGTVPGTAGREALPTDVGALSQVASLL